MRAAVFGVALLLMTALVAAQHESSPPPLPPLVPQSLTGATSFDLYCASCHGRGGAGDGPVASALRTRPADLRQLLRRHGGIFPRDQVRAYVDGTSRQPPAHGSSDMPVWGPTFRGLESSDARARVRLDNLVAFIESIQLAPQSSTVPAKATVAEGATLFQQYCAACHGRNGRGDGTMNSQLRQRPADLTKFAMRNGGAFPEARVARIIDGRDVSAHGATEMPVWGDVFKRAGDDGSDAVRARIAALVQFLASIQERPAE